MNLYDPTIGHEQGSDHLLTGDHGEAAANLNENRANGGNSRGKRGQSTCILTMILWMASGSKGEP